MHELCDRQLHPLLVYQLVPKMLLHHPNHGDNMHVRHQHHDLLNAQLLKPQQVIMPLVLHYIMLASSAQSLDTYEQVLNKCLQLHCNYLINNNNSQGSINKHVITDYLIMQREVFISHHQIHHL